MNYAESDVAGTLVSMMLALDSNRSFASVFGELTDQETYDFSRIVVPVRLALYEGDQLISRSQAKRIMHRVERFRNEGVRKSVNRVLGRNGSTESEQT